MWFQNSTWRNLVDMHIPDWNSEFLSKFSPQEYAQAMSAAHVDTAIVYAGNCLGMCFWPTKAGHMHASLQGRDICLETYDALRSIGINVVIYYNVWNRWAYDTHPDWRTRRIDGTDTLRSPGGGQSRFGQCCINNEAYREFVYRQIQDLSEHFPEAKGLWIDMIGYFGTVCYCSSCRVKFQQLSGQELPEIIDWSDPQFVQFQRARERWLADFAAKIRAYALQINPSLTLAFQAASLLSGWGGAASQEFLDQSDYLAGDFYGSAIEYSALCKYLSSLTRSKPMEFMTSRCYDLYHHTTTKTDQELLQSARGAYAHNAAFLFIDAIDPQGTLDLSLYDRMGRLYHEVESYANTVGCDARTIADVAFYFNTESSYEPEMNGTPMSSATTYYSLTAALERIAATMIANHVLYDIIGKPQLGEFSRYKVIVVAGQHTLDGSEIDAMRDFAKSGGKLVVVGQCGLMQPDGHQRSNLPLADVLGIGYLSETSVDRTYIAPTETGSSCFPENTALRPLGILGTQLIVRAAEDANVLATITLPYSGSREIHHFGSAISNPPATATTHPAVIERVYGNGLAMFIAGRLDNETLRPQRQVFSALIMHGIQPTLKTNAPEWVEIVVLGNSSGRAVRIGCINTSADTRNLVMMPFEIDLRVTGMVYGVRNVGNNHPVQFSQADGRLHIQTDQGVDFAMYEIDWRDA